MDTGAVVPVFLNKRAGTRATSTQQLQQLLGGRVLVEDVGPDALADRVRAEVTAGTMVVGVAGGDGTLRTAAAILAGTGTALLCVPTGTMNSFARRIGIDSVHAAAHALAAGGIRTTVIGTINDEVFLNTVTFGEYSRVVRMRERYRRYIGKWPAAAVAFSLALLKVRMVTLTLRTREAELVRRTPFVWIGIGWGSFPRVTAAAERRSTPDLEVAVVRSDGGAAAARFLLRLGVHMMRGTNTRTDPTLEVLNTRSLSVDAAHRIDFTADGETGRIRPPIRIGLHATGLRVLTAADAGIGGA